MLFVDNLTAWAQKNSECKWSFQLLNTGWGVSDLERCQTYTSPLSKGRICAWFKNRRDAWLLLNSLLMLGFRPLRPWEKWQQHDSPLPSCDFCKQLHQEPCLIKDELCTWSSLVPLSIGWQQLETQTPRPLKHQNPAHHLSRLLPDLTSASAGSRDGYPGGTVREARLIAGTIYTPPA